MMNWKEILVTLAVVIVALAVYDKGKAYLANKSL